MGSSPPPSRSSQSAPPPTSLLHRTVTASASSWCFHHRERLAMPQRVVLLSPESVRLWVWGCVLPMVHLSWASLDKWLDRRLPLSYMSADSGFMCELHGDL